MSSEFKWSSYGTYSTGIAGSGSPTLKNLANAARIVGNAIDNTSLHAIYMDLDLLCKFQSNPSAGGVVNVYVLPSVDGSNYADGSASVVPSPMSLIGQFPVQANTNAQRVAIRGVLVPPGLFKFLIENLSGQSMTNTDDENVLSYRSYDPTAV